MTATLRQLSERLLATRGCRRLLWIAPPSSGGNLRLDVLAWDLARGRPVLAVATTPRDRFAALVSLLGHAEVEAVCREGCSIQLHCWSRRPDGADVCEVLELRPGDFATERGCRDA
jgi:hypothetical protein